MKRSHYTKLFCIFVLVIAICFCSGCGQIETSGKSTGTKATKASLVSLLDSDDQDIYDEAIEAILQEDDEGYEQAIDLLSDLHYNDSEELLVYANIRLDLMNYVGQAQNLYDSIPDAYDIEAIDIRDQVETFRNDILLIANLQNEIDTLDPGTYSDREDYSNALDSLQSGVESLDSEYSIILDTSKVDTLRKDLDQELEKERKAAEEDRKAKEKQRKEKEKAEAKKAKAKADEKKYVWLSSGEVYHTRDNCPSLSRSNKANFIYGPKPPSGRRPCKRC